MRSISTAIGFPFGGAKGIPLRHYALRFLKPKLGIRVYDIIGDYDAEESGVSEYDLNPDDDVDAGFALQSMNKDNVTIWGGTDANGDTIRDLPGYNPLDPYEWLTSELDVDIFDTYLSDGYTARLFANFDPGYTMLGVYDRQLNCSEQNYVHQKMLTGNIWILNRAVWNDCAIWKDAAYWRDS